MNKRKEIKALIYLVIGFAVLIGSLGYINSRDRLGTIIPEVVAVFETSIVSKIDTSATSMTLVSGTTDDGTTLNGFYGFVIDEGSTVEEFVLATCVDTACTGMTRGISTITGTSSVTALKQEHRRGASVKMTDHPVLVTIVRILNGQGTLPSKLEYDNLTIGATDSGDTLVDKAYADNLVSSGVATSTESVSGKGFLATQIRMASSTYSADNPYFLHSRYATSSPDVRGLYSPISENNGYLAQEWFKLDESWTFSGGTVLTGSSYIASTTFTASTTWDILPEYTSDPIGGNEAVRKSYADNNDFIVIMTPGECATSGAVSTTFQNNMNTLSVANNSEGNIYCNGIVPKNATAITSIEYAFVRANNGSPILKFNTGEFNFATSTTMSADTGSEANYISGANDNTIGIITVPGASYNGLPVTGGDSIGVWVYRAGDDAGDTYEAALEFLGFKITYN